MNALEEFAKILAEDIKRYLEEGGSLKELEPEKVYEHKEKLEESN